MPGFCIFYTERNKQKNFDYEIYGSLSGCDAGTAFL